MIYDISPVNNYVGNDTTTLFDFNFYIDNASQIKVYLFDENNIKHTLTMDLDYSVNGSKSLNGGSVTFPLEGSSYSILKSNQKLSIELDIPASQETEFNNSSLLNLSSLEYSFDYLTRLIQILKRKISLCVKVEECSNNTPEDLMNSINSASISANLSANSAQESKNQAELLAQSANQAKDTADEILEQTKNIKDEIISCGMFKHNLFDIRISDYILNDIELKGWSIQGSYVNASDYPDFYQSCISQKENSNVEQLSLLDENINIYVNPNGHKFYDIQDKTFIDNWFTQEGNAEFYGVDVENERILLPRNNSFLMFDVDSSEITSSSSTSKVLYYCTGNTKVENAITNVDEITTSANDNLPLFSAMNFDFIPNNPSWIKAGETLYSAGIYKTCYDELIKALNGVNPNKINVVDILNMDSDFDYSQYWKVNQDNLSFQAPSKTSYFQGGENLYFKVANALQNIEIIDIADVLNSLSDKIGKQECPQYIVETYVNDKNGYIIYSNGFCQQWGYLVEPRVSTGTISLLKKYKDTNYFVIAPIDGGDCGACFVANVTSRSTSKFSFYNQFTFVANRDVAWMAFGYIN